MEEEEEHKESKFDEILNLFDLYWFHRFILGFSPARPSSSLPLAPTMAEAHAELTSLSPWPSPIRHRRTHSDESIAKFLPSTVKVPRLQTIPSGKESLHPTPSREYHVADTDTGVRKKPARMSRSMSELELEELKGLTDLGFHFSDNEVERDPRIVDIVPGLRRRSEGEVKVARRPYLSEAWRVRDEDDRKRVMRDWTILTNGDERDVKEQLRRWAHVVASTVR